MAGLTINPALPVSYETRPNTALPAETRVAESARSNSAVFQSCRRCRRRAGLGAEAHRGPEDLHVRPDVPGLHPRPHTVSVALRPPLLFLNCCRLRARLDKGPSSPGSGKNHLRCAEGEPEGSGKLWTTAHGSQGDGNRLPGHTRAAHCLSSCSVAVTPPTGRMLTRKGTT